MKKRTFEKWLSMILALAMAVSLAGFSPAFADELDPVVSINDHPLSLQSSGGDLQYSTDSGSTWTTYTGTITVTGSSAANKIQVLSGTHDVTLNGVTINVSSSDNNCAFSIAADAAVNLTLTGTNSLTSGSNCAGLAVPSGAALTVAASSTGSLTAATGFAGAGIGGNSNVNGTHGIINAGTVTINGGTISATSGQGAGIGGGAYGSAGNVTITGGSLTATCYYSGAGIGGGYGGNGGTVTITGGTVTATSGSSTGIGGGSAGSQGTCYISGGSVKASSMGPTPAVSSSDGTLVYLTTITLSGITAAKAVPDLTTTDASYGKTGLKTDSDGKLYLWLPVDTATTSATAAVAVFTGSVTTTADNTASDTFTKASAAGNVYVITHGAAGTNTDYYFYLQQGGTGDFISAGSDTEIGAAVEDIGNAVDSNSATVWFGETGTTSANVTGTLTVESGDEAQFGAAGTYTIKGKLAGSSSSAIIATTNNGTASLVIDGAVIENTGTGSAIINEGTGSITVKNGWIYSANRCAIASNSSGDVIIMGNGWSGDYTAGTLVQSDATDGHADIYTASGTVTVSGGTITANSWTISSFSVAISNGTITATDGVAVFLNGGTGNISGGTITGTNACTAPNFTTDFPGAVLASDNGKADAVLHISAGTITNTAATGSAVYNYNCDPASYSSRVYLSGTPAISGATADIVTNSVLYAADNSTPYTGGALTIAYADAVSPDNTVAVGSVTAGTNDMRFLSANTGYSLKLSNTDLLFTASSDYKVSGTVSAGTTGASVIGLVVTLYDSTDTGYATPLSVCATDENGSYTAVDVAAGTYVAVVAASADVYDQSVSAAVTVSNADVTSGADITLAKQTSASYDSSSSSSSNSASIVVDGVKQSAGTTKTSTNSDGQSVKTVTVNTSKLEAALESGASGTTVTIPVTGGADVSQGVLTGQAVKDMENKDAVLVVQTDSGSYTLPASEIDIDGISEQLGTDVDLSDITVTVSISEPSDSMTQVIENAAEDGGFTIVVPAVEYSVSCSYGGQTVEVTGFHSYVERMIAIPDGVDPSEITTCVVVDPDGTTHSVPTQITVVDGVYYAVINSMTNSAYLVIWNPIEFSDMEDHWAKDAVNDMGSRMIVSGVGDYNYAPDRDITRAEFAVIMVRALGLEAGTGESGFSDVASDDWYCGYVETASEYGLITGYPDGTFGPNDNITREQAMAIIARAMQITKLETSLTTDDISTLLAGFTDGASVSSYADAGVASCISAGVVTGKPDSTIAPRDNITRAEVAVIVERLLQKSDLI